jgi:hypothetical protein
MPLNATKNGLKKPYVPFFQRFDRFPMRFLFAERQASAGASGTAKTSLRRFAKFG